MITRIARFTSIVGHPAILMPVAAIVATGSGGELKKQLLPASLAVCCAIIFVVYSQIKIKSGRWQHVDASVKAERKELNVIASLALFAGASALLMLDVNSSLVFAMASSGAIFLCCHVFSKLAKPSLHVAFAIFAACLTYPNVIAMALLFSMAILLGWSRLHLERHSMFDIVVGAVIGFLAGICFQFLVH